MGLKKYIFGSLLLAIAIFAYAFSLESGDYRVEAFGYVQILPVAVWIITPFIVLFLLSVLHILFYGLKNYFAVKAISKDSDALVNLINKKILKEPSKVNLQNSQLKQIGSILQQLDINIENSDFSSENTTLSKTVDQILAINSGKYISSKELKLDIKNPLMVKNLNNRINGDDNFALEVLKKQADYSEQNVLNAFDKVIESKAMTTIKKIIDDLTFNADMAVKLFKKDSEQEEQFTLTNEQILNIIKKVELTNKQLVTIAQNYKKQMSPEQLIKLYEDISSYKEEYMSAYLYVLAEYEMIDKMRDIIENSGADEFIPFKALVDLKDAGKHTYSLESISFK